MNRYLWALRRELWESRWLYLAPTSIGAVLIVGFAVYARKLPAMITNLVALTTLQQHKMVGDPYEVVAGLLMLVGLISAVIYTVDALYGERRDRSLLFWKSLPVSDTSTVLAKLSIPVLVLPFIVWLTTFVVHIAMLVMSTAIVIGHGQNAELLWRNQSVFSGALPLLYHLVVIHGISMAPIYGWLLLVSSWAPRAPYVWAILPPAAVVFLERVAFGTHRVADFLIARAGGGDAMKSNAPATGSIIDVTASMPPLHLLLSPGLWAGILIAAMFAAATIHQRRRAQPI